jgi:hypothetical protein
MRIGRSIHPSLSDAVSCGPSCAHSFDALSLFHCHCAAICLIRRHRCITPPPRRRCSPPRRGGNGGGVGSAVGRGGGRGGGRLGDLPAPAGARRRRRRSRRCGVDGGVVDACGGRCLFVLGGELNEIKKIENKHLCLIWPPTGNSNTTTNQKHTHATQEVNVTRFDR